MVETWEAFFLGELGAAAAFAGLLFVSVSVNQQRILAISGVPERAIQALLVLFMVFAVSAIMLVPEPARLIGLQVLGLSIAYLFVLSVVQFAELRKIAPANRGHSLWSVFQHQIVAWLFLVSAVLLANEHAAAFAFLVPTTLMAFFVAGLNAWVLLIEINR
jgi:modulator of FtsH protease